jgi:hypothetical protein
MDRLTLFGCFRGHGHVKSARFASDNSGEEDAASQNPKLETRNPPALSGVEGKQIQTEERHEMSLTRTPSPFRSWRLRALAPWRALRFSTRIDRAKRDWIGTGKDGFGTWLGRGRDVVWDLVFGAFPTARTAQVSARPRVRWRTQVQGRFFAALRENSRGKSKGATGFNHRFTTSIALLPTCAGRVRFPSAGRSSRVRTSRIALPANRRSRRA